MYTFLSFIVVLVPVTFVVLVSSGNDFNSLFFITEERFCQVLFALFEVQCGPISLWDVSRVADRGFLVAVPGLDMHKVDTNLLCDNHFVHYNGELKKVKVEFHKNMAVLIVDQEIKVKGLLLLLVLASIPSSGSEAPPFVSEKRDAESMMGVFDSYYPPKTNILLDIRKTKEPTSVSWEKGFPAPRAFRIDISDCRGVDSAGHDILSWLKTPSEISRSLEKSVRHRHSRCFDLYTNLGDQEESIVYENTNYMGCPNVLDAGKQFKNYSFIEGAGRLPRFLTFPSSTELEAIPWLRGSSVEVWTENVYKNCG